MQGYLIVFWRVQLFHFPLGFFVCRAQGRLRYEIPLYDTVLQQKAAYSEGRVWPWPSMPIQCLLLVNVGTQYSAMFKVLQCSDTTMFVINCVVQYNAHVTMISL